MTLNFIDLKAQYSEIKPNIDRAIADVLESGAYIMGQEVAKLETRLSEYLGVNHTLVCSSGTDALVLPLLDLRLTKKDLVFTSPFTFFASAESISLAGGTPVFVDINPDTYNIDTTELRNSIQARVDSGEGNPRAVIPVDLFGLAADYKEIRRIAQDFNLFVLEDAAQGFGAPYHGEKAGSFGNCAATSFYPAKPLGCYGDGGAVFTNNSDLYDRLVSLRVHGQSTSGNKYDNVRIGMNARMDTIQAAILLEKLKIYDEELERRNQAAAHYTRRLADYVQTPVVPDGQDSVWAQYSIQVADRDKLQADLKNQGIPTAIFYPIPIHLSTAYKDLGYRPGDFPVSEHVAKHIISLPMHPYLEASTIDTICDAVLESIGN